MRSTCSWLDAVVSAACSVRQYFVSWVSSVVLGAVVGFGSDFGVCGLPNFAQNSVALRPDASMARRQTSDAALAAVVLSLAAAYFVRQYFTSSSRFVEEFVEGFVEGFACEVLGSALGAKRVQKSVDVSPDASIARRQDSDAAVPAVVLAVAPAYLVRQSLTALPTSLVFVSRRGVA